MGSLDYRDSSRILRNIVLQARKEIWDFGFLSTFNMTNDVYSWSLVTTWKLIAVLVKTNKWQKRRKV